MQMTLRNGFPIPSLRNPTDEIMDLMIEAAEQRSVVVQGVRSIRFLNGHLYLEFHGTKEVLGAQGETGWLPINDTTLTATLRPRDGVHPAVVVKGVAYGEYEIEQLELALEEASK